MALIPPFFLDCVVAIGFLASTGTTDVMATGFLYGQPIQQQNVLEPNKEQLYSVYLVTNRHVFEGHDKTFIKFNPQGNEPTRDFELNLTDTNKQNIWFTHPDPAIDIAIISINAQVLKKENVEFSFFQSDHNILTVATAKELGLTEGDGVFVLGFPMGMIGKERNYVIVRGGTIARIRDALAGSQKEFLIDSTIFPGSSGSPVVTKPETISIEGTKAIHTAYLIGIVKSYIPYTDTAYSIQNNKLQPRMIFQENSGLASVIPIHFVDEAINIKYKSSP